MGDIKTANDYNVYDCGIFDKQKKKKAKTDFPNVLI